VGKDKALCGGAMEEENFYRLIPCPMKEKSFTDRMIHTSGREVLLMG